MSNSLQYPHLPQEIIDEIIGNLHGDKNSLRACTFVCRNWLYASQTHLFYQLDVFVGRWYFGIPTFLMTIQEYPGIIPFVKSVRFDNGNSYMRTHLPGTSGPYQFVVDARVIEDILFVLYNLHTLIIHELWIQEQVPWEVPIPISQSRPVRRELKELVLEGCKVHFRKSPPRVQRVNPLLDVLNTFQRIDKLSILGPLHLPDDLDHPSTLQSIYPQLQIGSFTMTSGPYLNPRARTTFWSPFLQIVNASSISAFMYACIENEDAKLLTSSLSHLPNLRRFHINVGSIWGFEDIPMRTDCKLSFPSARFTQVSNTISLFMQSIQPINMVAT